LSCLGCGPGEEIQQYVIPVENDRVITSDRLKDEFGAIPFDWKAPESWTMAAADQFSKVAWEVGTKPDNVRITVTDSVLEAGIVPHLVRWRRQLSIEPDSSDDPMEGTEPLDVDGQPATYVEIEGPEQTFLGLLLPHQDKMWVFKMAGNNSSVAKQQDAFRTFCESVKIP